MNYGALRSPLRRLLSFRPLREMASSAGGEKKENRLGKERSPYLLQHKTNPVDWFPWGPEAFDKARKENKLIFLSVGYSTCHWCHVMERESFECAETGELLSRLFVPVKVDREERPDVDKLYMSFIQAISGRGGWPMSVFLTPELRPLTGGTYFPPTDQHGRPGFKSILKYIAAQWAEKPEEVKAQADMFHDAIKKMEAKSTEDGEARAPSRETLRKCFRQMHGQFDPHLGGIGKAPKFPQPSQYEFLLAYASLKDTPAEEKAEALAVVEKTLESMERGGIHDWVGQGYHRYSTDARWHVPHFEKMLYDQAQLAVLAAQAHQATGKDRYAAIARDILAYVDRDLSHPLGGFYSAEDADSLPTAGDKEKKEGAFCVWTHAELTALLDQPLADGSQHKLADLVVQHFQVKEGGNVDPHGDPHGELLGQNVLIARTTVAESGAGLGLDGVAAAEALERARLLLAEARARRPKPHLDDKLLAAWNGLMISGFAQVGWALGEQRYVERAVRAAEFVKKHLGRGEGGLLRAAYTEGKGVAQLGEPVGAFADDYAFLVQGLLDLYTASGDAQWLRWAEQLSKRLDAEFWDGQGGYFLSGKDGDANLLLRMRDDQDGAEPSANSVAALNGLRLSALLGDDSFRRRSEAVLKAWGQRIDKIPIVLPKMLMALPGLASPPPQVVIVGDEKGELIDALRKVYEPTAAVVRLGSAGGEWLRERVPHLADLRPVDGKPTAFVCRDCACSLPAHTKEELLDRLKG